MQILKYVAVIATSILACSAYAQNATPAAPAAPVVVTVGNEKGHAVYDIVVNPSASETLTTEDAIRKALVAAMLKVDPKSVNGKAINAALLAIKSSLADKYEPLTSPMAISIKIENRIENMNSIAVATTVVTAGGDTYEANTETTFNSATEVAQTNGNISVKSQNGAVTSLPVAVAITSSGELVGSVGNAGVTDTAVTTQSTSEVSVPTTPTSVKDADVAVETVPDATIVTSAEQ